ncbi:MAG: radical SAM domain-containing protein, partial [Desulfobacteraceae bacterium]|nr:radical SAM domain-containing protein [Desulfobacteraceae bacterium]
MKFEEYHTEAGETNDFSIIINKKGDANYTKISYPLKYGIFSRLETKDLIFEFNLNNEIKHAKAKSQDWLNPSEWLKRTTGNDWIYYSTGGYTGVYSALGEYYLPNLMYPTNSLLGGKPFKEKNISNIIQNWHSLLKESIANASNLPVSVCEWLEKVKDITPENLDHKAKKLFKITGSRVTVLPPDTRHVDYNVIPLNISDGCLYKCRF